MTSQRPHDLVIVGGGMVGASLAIALANRGLSIALIEAHPPGADSQPSYDDRAIALAPNDPDALELRGTFRYLNYLLNLVPDAEQELSLAEQDLVASVRANPQQASALTTLDPDCDEETWKLRRLAPLARPIPTIRTPSRRVNH